MVRKLLPDKTHLECSNKHTGNKQQEMHGSWPWWIMHSIGRRHETWILQVERLKIPVDVLETPQGCQTSQRGTALKCLEEAPNRNFPGCHGDNCIMKMYFFRDLQDVNLSDVSMTWASCNVSTIWQHEMSWGSDYSWDPEDLLDGDVCMMMAPCHVLRMLASEMLFWCYAWQYCRQH